MTFPEPCALLLIQDAFSGSCTRAVRPAPADPRESAARPAATRPVHGLRAREWWKIAGGRAAESARSKPPPGQAARVAGAAKPAGGAKIHRSDKVSGLP